MSGKKLHDFCTVIFGLYCDIFRIILQYRQHPLNALFYTQFDRNSTTLRDSDYVFALDCPPSGPCYVHHHFTDCHLPTTDIVFVRTKENIIIIIAIHH